MFSDPMGSRDRRALEMATLMKGTSTLIPSFSASVVKGFKRPPVSCHISLFFHGGVQVEKRNRNASIQKTKLS